MTDRQIHTKVAPTTSPQGYQYVTWAEVEAAHTPSEYRKFLGFMAGFSCPAEGAYWYDYVRWVRQNQPIQQLSEDFD